MTILWRKEWRTNNFFTWLNSNIFRSNYHIKVIYSSFYRYFPALSYDHNMKSLSQLGRYSWVCFYYKYTNFPFLYAENGIYLNEKYSYWNKLFVWFCRDKKYLQNEKKVLNFLPLLEAELCAKNWSTLPQDYGNLATCCYPYISPRGADIPKKKF